jgi:PII-like signaling protein
VHPDGPAPGSGTIFPAEIISISWRIALADGTVVFWSRTAAVAFGAASVLHTTRILRPSHDLPIVIEVVELEKNLQPFIERVEEMLDEVDCGAMITVEKADVIHCIPRGRER